MKKTFKLLFSYQGRQSRLQLWFANLLTVIALGQALRVGVEKLSLPFQQESIIVVSGFTILAWIATAGLTKRLHDRNRSGWFQFLFFIPLFAYGTLNSIYGPQPGIIGLGFLSVALGLWILIDAGLSSGTIGSNRFGSDPCLFNEPVENWEEPTALPSDGLLSMPSLSPLEPEKPDGQSIPEDALKDWLGGGSKDTLDEVPEILASTTSAFEAPKTAAAKPELPTTPLNQLTTPPPEVPARAEAAVATLPPAVLAEQQRATAEEQKSRRETDRFLDILKERATSSPAHALYLQRGALSGNSWAKLEIAATWLTDPTVTLDKSDLAMEYLRELADSSQSYLGAEREAAYFLGEIYRVGMRYSYPSEDLSFKYYSRAAALGHEAAQRGLASQIGRALQQGKDAAFVQPLVEAALNETESATTLLNLIELDWSITYAESISLILRTLVDQGNGHAARLLGRMLLEQNDLDMAIKIFERADKLDEQSIDQIMQIVRTGTAKDGNINALIDLLQKHADLDDAYAHYHIAHAYAEGIGKPQDNVMAYLHVSLAAARIHGKEREALSKLRDDLKVSLSEADIALAQTMIRDRYRH